MKLIGARVQNFRSVNDSSEFSVGDLTCLVGKNESGKTTILQALAGLKPYDDDPKLRYDRLRDYPRRHLTRYAERHPNTQAVVVVTKWQLEAGDIAAVEAVLGAGALINTVVEVSRLYEGEGTIWDVAVDHGRVITNLLETLESPKAVRTKALSATTTHALAAMPDVEGTGAPGWKAVKDAVAKFRTNDATLTAIDVLAKRMPHFLYFSNYDRMEGAVSLEHLQAAKQAKTLTPSEKVFLAFLEFASTSAEDLAKASRYEELKSRVEAASISITDQIFEYWSQNRHLSVEFDVTAGKPQDPPPLNTGQVMHARIRNELHRMSVPFNERSAGFVWFFSFLVLFTQVEKTHGDVVILLDEPGLNLHATAQADLLRYIREKLLPRHQVIYTTHSPFMVPTNDLSAVRTVEDVVRATAGGRLESVGTVVGDDVLSTDRETLFPLQGALGYGITQSLFVGENTLLVEGPAEILYFQAASAELEARGRKGLDRRWTVCPSYGVDKVQAFLSLFGGNNLHCAVLVDLAEGQKGKIEKLRKLEGELLRSGRVFTVADFTGGTEADVEDLFDPAVFAAILNGTYALIGTNALTGPALAAIDAGGTQRLVRKAEVAINRALPPSSPEMSHYSPARWLIEHPEVLRAQTAEVNQTLENFERVFAAFNGLL